MDEKEESDTMETKSNLNEQLNSILVAVQAQAVKADESMRKLGDRVQGISVSVEELSHKVEYLHLTSGKPTDGRATESYHTRDGEDEVANTN